MANCLIALGSNLGDREATLESALAALDETAGIHLHRASEWHASRPIGVGDSTHEFLNGAALLETTREPGELLAILQRIELDHGRQRHDRWTDRTLDLDLLIYERRVIDSTALTLPHPRMSFRRFVLVPAVEIAGPLIHPTIGWTLGQLLRHLDAGANSIAIVSPSEMDRHELATQLAARFSATPTAPPIALDNARRWPQVLTTWLSVSASPTTPDPAAYPGANIPKLTILLDSSSPELVATAGDDFDWGAMLRQPGRGPTLKLGDCRPETVLSEVSAAIQSVWPHLGPTA